MKKSGILTIILCFLMLLFLLSGCGKSNDDNAKMEEPQKAAAAESHTLKVTKLAGNSGKIQDAGTFRKATVLCLSNDESRIIKYLADIPTESAEDTVLTLIDTSIPATSTPFFYLLYGWSGWGGDDKRQIQVDSVQLVGHSIDIYVTRPTIEYEEPIMGTTDMKFIGWSVEADHFEPGDYTLKLFERDETVKVTSKPYSRGVVEEGEYQLKKEAAFTAVINES